MVTKSQGQRNAVWLIHVFISPEGKPVIFVSKYGTTTKSCLSVWFLSKPTPKRAWKNLGRSIFCFPSLLVMREPSFRATARSAAGREPEKRSLLSQAVRPEELGLRRFWSLFPSKGPKNGYHFLEPQPNGESQQKAMATELHSSADPDMRKNQCYVCSERFRTPPPCLLFCSDSETCPVAHVALGWNLFEPKFGVAPSLCRTKPNRNLTPPLISLCESLPANAWSPEIPFARFSPQAPGKARSIQAWGPGGRELRCNQPAVFVSMFWFCSFLVMGSLVIRLVSSFSWTPCSLLKPLE